MSTTDSMTNADAVEWFAGDLALSEAGKTIMNVHDKDEFIRDAQNDDRPRCPTCAAIRMALLWQIDEHRCCADAKVTVAALALDCPHIVNPRSPPPAKETI